MSTPERPQLTPLRWQVLALLASGANNREIAAVLRLSPATVNNHLRAIYRCLPLGDATNRRAAAVAWYLRQGPGRQGEVS